MNFFDFSNLFKKKPAPAMYLGFDLNKWHFLGATTISFVDDNDVISRSCSFHFFEHKETKERKYRAQQNIVGFRDHKFFVDVIEAWKVGLKEHYSAIKEPSDFLKTYYSKYVWDNETKWWITKVNKETDGNIIKVDFKK